MAQDEILTRRKSCKMLPTFLAETLGAREGARPRRAGHNPGPGGGPRFEARTQRCGRTAWACVTGAALRAGVTGAGAPRDPHLMRDDARTDAVDVRGCDAPRTPSALSHFRSWGGGSPISAQAGDDAHGASSSARKRSGARAPRSARAFGRDKLPRCPRE